VNAPTLGLLPYLLSPGSRALPTDLMLLTPFTAVMRALPYVRQSVTTDRQRAPGTHRNNSQSKFKGTFAELFK